MPLPPRYSPTGETFDGGMSDVTVCNDTHLERKVVVKYLKKGTDSRRLLDELAALQSIRSKHVVQIYDVIKDEHNKIVAIVEEYLPGQDLTSEPVPTDANEFLRLAFAIAEGIADVHAHNRVHRDIKRQNMKFDAEDCLKLFDFGLSKDGAQAASTLGEIGTPGYMAPELFEATKGGRTNFTKAVDTYAFGATLLAILLGRLPRDMRESPPIMPCSDADFTKLKIGIPKDLATVFNACLSVKPDARPQMADVARLIGAHLLKDKHRALLVSQKDTYTIDAASPAVRLHVSQQGTITIRYDGFAFKVAEVDGKVAINNSAAKLNDKLPDSCVIVLGGSELGGQRTIFTVDVSHPEVTL